MNRLFVLSYNNTNGNANTVKRDSRRKYFLPRVSITKYHVLVDGRNFYDQPISDQIRKYNEVKMVKGEDYTTGSLFDLKYYKDHYQLIASNLYQQKKLNANPRSIKQIELNFMLDTDSQILTVLEKSKETIRILQANSKSFVNAIPSSNYK